MSKLFTYLFRIKLMRNDKITSIFNKTDLIVFILGFTMAKSKFNFSNTMVFSNLTMIYLMIFFLGLFNYASFNIFNKEDISTKQLIETLSYTDEQINLSNYFISLIYVFKISLIYSLAPMYFVFMEINKFSILFIFLLTIISISFVSIMVGLILKIILYKMSFKLYNIRYYPAIIVSLIFIGIRLLSTKIEGFKYVKFIFPYSYASLIIDSRISVDTKQLIYVLTSTIIFILISFLIHKFYRFKFNEFNPNDQKFKFVEKKNSLQYENALNNFSKSISMNDDYQKMTRYRIMYMFFYFLFYSFFIFESSDFGNNIFSLLKFSSIIFIVISNISSIALIYAEDTGAIDYFETIPGYSHKYLLTSSIKIIIIRGIKYSLLLSIISFIENPIDTISYFLLLVSLLLLTNLITYLYLKNKKLYNYRTSSSTESGRDVVVLIIVFLALFTGLTLTFLNWEVKYILVIVLLTLPFNIYFLHVLRKNTYIHLYNNFKQKSKNDCGLAALQTLIMFNGLEIVDKNKYEIIRRNHKKGLSLNDIIETGMKYNIQLDGFHCDFKDLSVIENKLPIICHSNIGDGHYYVLFEIVGENVIVGDPDKKYVKVLDKSKFFKKMSGNILIQVRR